MINFIYLACKDLRTLVPGSLKERKERERTRFIETVVVLIMQEASLCDKTFILMMTPSNEYCSHFHFYLNRITKGTELGCSGWPWDWTRSVSLSKCIFLPYYHVISVVLSETSERSICVALGDGQAETATGHPPGASVVSLPRRLMGSALGEPLGPLTGVGPPLFPGCFSGLRKTQRRERPSECQPREWKGRMTFRTVDTSFHSVVENAKLRREKFKCLLFKEQSLCCVSQLFNIKILPPDEVLDGRSICKHIKNGGFFADWSGCQISAHWDTPSSIWEQTFSCSHWYNHASKLVGH